MAAPWVEVEQVKEQLSSFFASNHAEVAAFGSTVNQTFEAFVFASLIQRYRDENWQVEIVRPIRDSEGKPIAVRLKFNTNGRPGGYSFARCVAPDGTVQVDVRHQLRVQTAHVPEGSAIRANLCLDVAVIRDFDADELKTNDAVPNAALVTFGEAKHMSAFAELVAQFVGMVHELQPERLKPGEKSANDSAVVSHPSPFLYVSGILLPTAEGIKKTIELRGLDLSVFDQHNALSTLPLFAKMVTRKEAALASGRSAEGGDGQKAAHKEVAVDDATRDDAAGGKKAAPRKKAPASGKRAGAADAKV